MCDVMYCFTRGDWVIVVVVEVPRTEAVHLNDSGGCRDRGVSLINWLPSNKSLILDMAEQYPG